MRRETTNGRGQATSSSHLRRMNGPPAKAIAAKAHVSQRSANKTTRGRLSFKTTHLQNGVFETRYFFGRTALSSEFTPAGRESEDVLAPGESAQGANAVIPSKRSNSLGNAAGNVKRKVSKRVPQRLPTLEHDIYVSSKSNFMAQYRRAEKLLNDGRYPRQI